MEISITAVLRRAERCVCKWETSGNPVRGRSPQISRRSTTTNADVRPPRGVKRRVSVVSGPPRIEQIMEEDFGIYPLINVFVFSFYISVMLSRYATDVAVATAVVPRAAKRFFLAAK